MARLQDFQTVTPTASDKLLVVQSQGQGLVSYGSKLDTANPTGTGSLSLNRKSGTTTGVYSVAEGYNGTASGDRSHAEGSGTTASALGSHSEGSYTVASGNFAHAEGDSVQASGFISHAEGNGTKATRKSQHVFGEYNVAETGDATVRGNYIEIVGKGTADNARSNARTLDWSGNEVLAGDLTIKGNKSLDNAITPIAANLTYAQGVTYVSGGVYSVGKLVVINLRLNFDSAPSSGNDIVSGLPSALNLGTDLYTRFMTINGSYSVTTGGGLRAYNATAGVAIISGTYISV